MKMLQWVVRLPEMLHRLYKVLVQKRVDDVGLLCSDPVPRPAMTDQHPHFKPIIALNPKKNAMVIGLESFNKLSIWF
jgi:hypothetical protein